jgi:CRP-like cAMP-binding protein
MSTISYLPRATSRPAHTYGNRLLDGLPSAEWDSLAPRLERVTARPRDCLVRAGKPIQFVYFLEHGWCSVTASNGIRTVEVGVIGPEGAIGAPLFAGLQTTPHNYILEHGGAGFRLSAADLLEVMPRTPAFNARVQAFIQNLFIQASESIVANAICSLEARVARCLLTCHDRAREDELSITHDMLSRKLGTRRAGITNAIHMLEGHGLIRATRGTIRILDREGLEQATGGAYGAADLGLSQWERSASDAHEPER